MDAASGHGGLQIQTHYDADGDIWDVTDGDTSGVTCGPAPARHVGVAAFIVNNNPEAMKLPRRSFHTAASWCFAQRIRRPGRAQREPGPITTGGDHGSPLSPGPHPRRPFP